MVLKHIQKCITCNCCTGCFGFVLVWKREKQKMFSVCLIFYIICNGKNTLASLVSQRVFYSDLSQITKLTFLHTFREFSIYSRTDYMSFDEDNIY